MKRIILFFLSLIIGTVLLIGVFRVVGWEEIKSAFLIFAGWQGIVIVFLTALMLFFGMWKWKIILKSQGCNISNKNLAAPYLAGFSLIYLFPMIILGGEMFRAYIIKDKYGIPWKTGMVSTIIDKILEGTTFLVAVLAGLSYFLFKIGIPTQNLAIITGIIILLITIATALFYFQCFRKKSVAKWIIRIFGRGKFINGELLELERSLFGFFRPGKKDFWWAMLLAFLRVIVTWARCWILIIFLGGSIGIMPALAILAFYYISIFIPIPAALGTHEVFQAFSFSALNIGVGIAPAFTMIQRGSEIVMAVIGGLLVFRLGVGLLQSFLFKKIENLFEKH
jgi:uncharacterized protein (TIRG00374 family)